jgi:hypothetical protein
MKRFALLFIIFTLAAILIPARTNAGILRTLGHAGKSVIKETANFGKSLAHDIGHDFAKWIY